MKYIDLESFFSEKNNNTEFIASLSERGGYVTFSNSGRRGPTKYFSLGIDAFITSFKDILKNIDQFKKGQDYEEKQWRNFSRYFSDDEVKTILGVQTKPFFSTLVKLAEWANEPVSDNVFSDDHITIEHDIIKNSITELEKIADEFKPKIKTANIPLNNIIIREESIRDFSKKVFDFLYQSNWSELIGKTSTHESEINGIHYKSHDLPPFKRLIGEFDQRIIKEDLTTSNTLRFFEKPIFERKDKFFYFSTQWNGEGEYNLSYQNLKKFVQSNFPNYVVENTGEAYLLKKALSGICFEFKKDTSGSGLHYSEYIIRRFVTSLQTKPFLILTGLSGSGKTKLAQAFAKWIIEDEEQLNLVPVGADWTNREPLLGYPNALEDEKYVLPESGVLQLILDAQKDENRPYFLILDEMNLSHVERYFADFLSAIESKEEIKLHSGEESWEADGYWVPSTLTTPKNLFIIGTVNIDETTYMFSPKVLDRANVIEFRVSKYEMEDFLKNPTGVDLSELEGKGAGMAEDFLKIASNQANAFSDKESLSKELIQFFENLSEVGAEFGYRTAHEINRFASLAEQLTEDWEFEHIMDAAISQKLLPKLHGSRRKLEGVLFKLGQLCIHEGAAEELLKKPASIDWENNVKYPISLEKIVRMHKGLLENGFTSFAEA